MEPFPNCFSIVDKANQSLRFSACARSTKHPSLLPFSSLFCHPKMTNLLFPTNSSVKPVYSLFSKSRRRPCKNISNAYCAELYEFADVHLEKVFFRLFQSVDQSQKSKQFPLVFRVPLWRTHNARDRHRPVSFELGTHSLSHFQSHRFTDGSVLV